MKVSDDIKQFPIDVMLEQKRRIRNMMVLDVMQKLWELLPDKMTANRPHDFTLNDGTKCWLKRFSAPNERDGEAQYGFDVWLEDGKPLDHIEFLVKSSGFGGAV